MHTDALVHLGRDAVVAVKVGRGVELVALTY